MSYSQRNPAWDRMHRTRATQVVSEHRVDCECSHRFTCRRCLERAAERDRAERRTK